MNLCSVKAAFVSLVRGASHRCRGGHGVKVVIYLIPYSSNFHSNDGVLRANRESWTNLELAPRTGRTRQGIAGSKSFSSISAVHQMLICLWISTFSSIFINRHIKKSGMLYFAC